MSAVKIFWVGIAAIILIGIWTMSSEPPKREPAEQPVTRTLKGPVVRTFTEADIFFDDQTRPYKDLIVRAVNKIAREDPRCRDSLDPGGVVMSPSKSKPGKPVFFVTCGAGAKAVNVYFSEGDLAEGKAFKAPVHIDQTRAVRLCEDYAKSAANFPSTVDFSRLWDLAVTEHPNGNTTVLSSFRAKNAFGLELEHNIRCLLNAGGLIEANIFEKR